MKEGWRGRVGEGICSNREVGGDPVVCLQSWVALAPFPLIKESVRNPAHLSRDFAARFLLGKSKGLRARAVSLAVHAKRVLAR